jgi:hypothetical protein
MRWTPAAPWQRGRRSVRFALVVQLCLFAAVAAQAPSSPVSNPYGGLLAAHYRCCVGTHVRIGMFSFSVPPLFTLASDGSYSGLMPTIIHELSSVMGFSYAFVPLGTSPAAFLPRLMQGEADCFVMDMQIVDASANITRAMNGQLLATAPLLYSHMTGDVQA